MKKLNIIINHLNQYIKLVWFALFAFLAILTARLFTLYDSYIYIVLTSILIIYALITLYAFIVKDLKQ